MFSNEKVATFLTKKNEKGNRQFPKLKTTHVNMSFIYLYLQQIRGKKTNFPPKIHAFFFNTQVTHRKHPARPICCRRCSNLDIRGFSGPWFDKNHLEIGLWGFQLVAFPTFILGETGKLPEKAVGLLLLQLQRSLRYTTWKGVDDDRHPPDVLV